MLGYSCATRRAGVVGVPAGSATAAGASSTIAGGPLCVLEGQLQESLPRSVIFDTCSIMIALNQAAALSTYVAHHGCHV